jgi:triosephosphate isomerase
VDAAKPLYIGASTKAYLGYETTINWLRAAAAAQSERALDAANIQTFVAPSAPLLLEARGILANTSCWVGAQDGQWQTGAATGAVSMELLADIGMDFVELGHAERSSVFGESVEETRRKAVAAAAAGLRLLFCVGEPDGTTAVAAAEHCLDQIRAALDGIPADHPSYVNDVIAATRERVHAEFGANVLGIVYGGSAGPSTLEPLTEADGLFLGRFAHDPANYARVLDDALLVARSR